MLIELLIAALVFGLLWYGITFLPERFGIFKTVAQVVVVVMAIIYLLKVVGWLL